MKYKTLLKKLNIKPEDFDSIKNAVAEQEAKTTGEIAIAVTPESGHYSFWELLAADIFAAIVIAALIPFSNMILSIYKTLYWQNQPGYILPVFFIVTCFASIAIGFFLCNIPAIDRLIIPSSVKKQCVTNRAMRYFTESGVYQTKSNSGILIFISYMEHQVRIIADSGIAAKISQDMWNLIADELSEEIKKGNATKAFIGAIEKCGALLEQNFPAEEENPNELPDGLVIIGDEEWN